MRTKTVGRAVVMLLVTAAAVAAAPTGADAQASGCPSVGTAFDTAGPFDVTVESGSQHTYYSPAELGTQGCTTHPVILWGNGTGASPSTYDGLLEHFASHGFIVAAANTANAGSGQEMLAGLDNLAEFNGDSGSRFFNRVDLDNVGSTGHSQGGGGAMAAAEDERVHTTFPLEPWLGEGEPLTGTAFLMAGQNDTIVSPSSVESDYNAASDIPAAFGELAGASHFTAIGSAGGFRGAATGWARWQLMDDANGRDLFVGADCGLCTSSAWSDYQANELLQSSDPGDPGDPDPPDPPDPTCVTATNSEHEDAGRATIYFVYAFAVGSGDFLGFPSGTSSLEQTSAGVWTEVDAC